jgi:anti-anti-sigma regulatory factor
MELTCERVGSVGIFNFSGELTREHEDNLKIALMRALHSTDRAVLNFKKVSLIDRDCLQLIKEAYYASVRLKNPLILTNLQQDYLTNILHHAGRSHAANSLSADENEENNGIDKEAVFN